MLLQASTDNVLAESGIRNAVSVDVEDFFQVSAFEPYVERDSWSSFDCRVPANVDRILEVFDQAGARGTFFCLGWVAERYPELIRRIAELGHEVASHGFSHIQVTNQTQDEFRQDVRRTKRLLEDVSGVAVNGYRAASFSISADNPWAYEVLDEAGHLYSSSVYPIRHDRYGMRDKPRFPYRPHQAGIVEIPVTTVEFMGLRLPTGGGGYFRLMPYLWTHWGIGRVNQRDRRSAVFYFHPWELDPEQPRISGLDPMSKFRHYVNLRRTERKLERLLASFRWLPMQEVFSGLINREAGRAAAASAGSTASL